MKNIALQRIKDMKPYNPPLSGRRAFSGLLLDFNERTSPPSSTVQKAIRALLKSDNLQLYPEYGGLERTLGLYASVAADQIMITNGSDQGIDLIFRSFTDSGDTVIIPSPTFAMFSQSAEIVGNRILRPFYEKETLAFPLKELLSMITRSVKLIVICNPNSPTGTLVSRDDIELIARKVPHAIILVDEAYFEFSNVTVVPLIKRYPNIIVVRTLSKAFGIPSLRVGYIVAANYYIAELLKVRGPYDINMIAYTASEAALDDLEEAQKYANEVMNQAKPMVEQFFIDNQVPFYPSAGNFLLYKPIIKQEAEVLRENGILVRPQDKKKIENTIRITIGTVDQMKQFISVYRKVILLRNKAKKFAFLDRDGTLIFEPQDTFQIDSIDKLKILEGVIRGLKELIRLGYELIMITNQDGLGTPSFPQADFDSAQNKMLSIFKENGITFQGIFICPHFASDRCNCRKPKIGLVKQLMKENRIDKKESFVCGDRLTDKQLAKNLGVRFVPMQTNGNFCEALTKERVLI